MLPSTEQKKISIHHQNTPSYHNNFQYTKLNLTKDNNDPTRAMDSFTTSRGKHIKDKKKKMAKFTDLPFELHMAILKHLLSSYNELNGKDVNLSRSSIFNKSIRPLSFLNKTWKSLIQEKSFSIITIRGDGSNRLDRLVDLVKSNSELLTYIREVRIFNAFGSSLDKPATKRRNDFKKLQVERLLKDLEKRQEKEHLSIPGAQDDGPSSDQLKHQIKHLKRKEVVLRHPPLSIHGRMDAFLRVWNGLRDLLALSASLSSTTDTLDLKVKKIFISAKDMADGRFNREKVPQYGFVPRLLLNPLDNIKRILPLDLVGLESVVFEPMILDYLEVNPAIISAVLMKQVMKQEGVKHVGLKMSDIRGYRLFRQDVYDGLANTINDIALNSNITSLVLTYPSSYNIHQDHAERVFALADLEADSDPLCKALNILSRQLTRFQYYGRISKHLFTIGSSNSNNDDKNTDTPWPNLEDYVVSFESVDSFGRFILVGDDEDEDLMYPFNLIDPTTGHHLCSECGVSEGEIWDCESGFVEKDFNPASMAVQMVSPESTQLKEGIDWLKCENCRKFESCYDVFPTYLLDELFETLTDAVLKMPKLQKFIFKASACKDIFFAYWQEKGAAVHGDVWIPDKKILDVWHTRFPGIKIGPMRKKGYHHDMPPVYLLRSPGPGSTASSSLAHLSTSLVGTAISTWAGM